MRELHYCGWFLGPKNKSEAVKPRPLINHVTRGAYNMPTRSVINGDYRIISLLCGLGSYHKRRYVYPSQEWIIEKLQQFYGRGMSRSTLCRHMSSLEANGFIKRTKRHTADKLRGMVFRSTLYQLTRKALRFATYMTGCAQLKAGKKPFRHPKEPCATSATISKPYYRDYSRDLSSTGPPAENPDSKDSSLKIFKRFRQILAK